MNLREFPNPNMFLEQSLYPFFMNTLVPPAKKLADFCVGNGRLPQDSEYLVYAAPYDYVQKGRQNHSTAICCVVDTTGPDYFAKVDPSITTKVMDTTLFADYTAAVKFDEGGVHFARIVMKYARLVSNRQDNLALQQVSLELRHTSDGSDQIFMNRFDLHDEQNPYGEVLWFPDSTDGSRMIQLMQYSAKSIRVNKDIRWPAMYAPPAAQALFTKEKAIAMIPDFMDGGAIASLSEISETRDVLAHILTAR